MTDTISDVQGSGGISPAAARGIGVSRAGGIVHDDGHTVVPGYFPIHDPCKPHPLHYHPCNPPWWYRPRPWWHQPEPIFPIDPLYPYRRRRPRYFGPMLTPAS